MIILSAGVLPYDLPSKVFHFDASDSATITLNGSDVSQWDSKFPGSYDAVQSTAADQPLYDTSTGLNGVSCVSFDASNTEHMEIANVPLTETDILFAMEQTNTGSMLIEQSVNVNLNDGFYIYGTNTFASRTRKSASITNFNVGNNWLNSAGDSVIRMKFSGDGSTNNYAIYINNVFQAGNNNSVGSSSVTDDIYLCSRAGSSLHMSALVGEVVCYTKSQSDALMNELSLMLQCKWKMI